MSNKNHFFLCFFCKYAGKENCTKLFSAFFKHFFFYKQIKNWGGKFSEKPSTPFFFFAFIGAGGDENLKKYLAWPYINILFNEIEISQLK